MINIASSTAMRVKPGAAEIRQTGLQEIGAKWGKFLGAGALRAQEQGRRRHSGRRQVQPRQGCGAARHRGRNEGPAYQGPFVPGSSLMGGGRGTLAPEDETGLGEPGPPPASFILPQLICSGRLQRRDRLRRGPVLGEGLGRRSR